VGNLKIPGWGATGVGAPPLMKTSLWTRRDLTRPSTAANEHLKGKKKKNIQLKGKKKCLNNIFKHYLIAG
jgi:hypothetical protein